MQWKGWNVKKWLTVSWNSIQPSGDLFEKSTFYHFIENFFIASAHQKSARQKTENK